MKSLCILALLFLYFVNSAHIQAQPHTSNNDYKNYWNGPVYSVQKTRGWYKENFGERQLENIDEIQVIVFDEKGRIILERYISSKKMYSTVFIYDDTSSEKSMKEISLSLDIKQPVPQDLYSAIKNLEALDFEEYLTKNGIKSELNHKYKYNTKGIILQHDILKTGELCSRFTQEWDRTKQAYKFNDYGENGNLKRSGFCYYIGKRLTKADVQPWFESKIATTYYYNNRGFITKHLDHSNNKVYSKGVYNINPQNGFDEGILLGKNIKYDSHGNVKSYQSDWQPNVWINYNIEYINSNATNCKKIIELINNQLTDL